MFGAKFDLQVNSYKKGGIVDVPYPYNSYMVINYKRDYYMQTEYEIDVKFMKKK